MLNLLAQVEPDAAPDVTGTAEAAVSRISALKDEAIEFVQTNGLEFAVNVVLALVIYYVGKIAASIITRIAGRALQRAKADEMLARFLTNIVYAVLMVVVVMAALNQLGVDTTSVAAILAAAGFAVGMALQGSLGNFASGVMLIIFRPFNTGNFIDAGGTKGIVEEIDIFHTTLRTPDNIRVIVPNSQITSAVITNFAANPTRRIDLVIGCGYDDDLLAVKSFLLDVISSDERVLKDPEPLVAVDSLGDSSINFVVRPWVNSEDFFATKCDLTERIKLGFDERGFNFPYPSRDVYVHQTAEA
jgi:small conductance mechanosensitive channel